jgi:2-dehydropantoate 2-reductase
MKICIYGAGAIGGYIGVMLKRAGADVSLVARGSHLEAINQNGLKLQIKGEELSAEIPASSNPADLGPQDYVIIALKAHQAWEVAREMTPLLGPNTAVVTAQNVCPGGIFTVSKDNMRTGASKASIPAAGNGMRSGRNASSAARSIPQPK